MPKTFSSTILDKINKKADQLFPMDLLRSPASDGELPEFLRRAGHPRQDFDENYSLFIKEWFKAAEIVYQEFEAEGLTNTCAEIRKLINDQKRYTNHV